MNIFKNCSAETTAARASGHIDEATGGVSPSIQPSTTFARDSEYALIDAALSYGRDENTGYPVVEKTLCDLEGGAEALLFGSGMAAASAILQSLQPGDRIVAPRIMYWGLRHWLQSFSERWGLQLDFYDPDSTGSLEDTVAAAETRILWIETPANPTWEIIDIAAAAECAHKNGALLVVDSTVSTPVLTQPIKLGADIVMHAATKYLNGHCDVVAGALVFAERDNFFAEVREARIHAGAILGSFEAWLLQRGMRTLYLRVQKASASALTIAKHFENHDRLNSVLYPGLESHSGHAIAQTQMIGGFGGMLSILVDGGEQMALKVAKRCGLFARATSLGGVESLIEHRRTIEGPHSPIPPELLRLSIGIESVEDLIADLEQALDY